MDPKHFILDSTIIKCFPSWNYSEMYCFTHGHVDVITMNPFRIVERISHKLLNRVHNITYQESDNTFIMNNRNTLIKFDPDMRTVTELLNFESGIDDYKISPDGRFISVLVGEHPNVSMNTYEDFELIDSRPIDTEEEDVDCADIIDDDGYTYVQSDIFIQKYDPYDKRFIATYVYREELDWELSSDSKLLIGFDGDTIEIANTSNMERIGYMEAEYDDYTSLYLSSDLSKIFKITKQGTEIYSTYNMELLSFIDTHEILPVSGLSRYWRICNVSDSNDMLFIVTSSEIVYIYDIKKMKYVGEFKVNRVSDWDSKIIITKNHRYLFMYERNYLVRFDLIQLDCNDQKKALLAGEDIPNNSVYRFTHDRLYDWHLMGEIFKYLPSL